MIKILDGKSQFLIEQMQGFNLAKSIINQELTGIFNTETLADMTDTIRMYDIYSQGADFNTDKSSNDWNPAQWHAKQIKSLIDKEARFMFSVPPDIRLIDPQSQTSDNSRLVANEELLNKVLKTNKFSSKLVRAGKDYLIGKRIAITINFNLNSGVSLSFLPSLEFIYETDPTNVDVITKFIQFYNVVVNDDKNQQRIYKKKWYMENGICRVVEEIYDGNANLIETLTPDQPTRLNYIPAVVVINDGLSGDPFGVSEVESLEDTESYYSKLSSKDIDSIRKGADQITYAIDADPRTTKGLSRSPGAFWDLSTDPAQDGKTAQVGALDNSMAYSPALDITLQRLKNSMHEQLDVPNLSGDALQGVITSGKTMQAIYWGLMVRCDEKMLDWTSAFEFIAETIIEGCRVYPEIARIYVEGVLAEDYRVVVENNYPILNDEIEEKQSDILEVNAKVMSRKAYMKKWRGMTDKDAEAELEQIKLESAMLEQENYLSEEQIAGGEGNEV